MLLPCVKISAPPFHATPMLSDSHGCLLETASTVAPPPLPAEATTDTGKGGGGGGGGGMSTNAVNTNISRNRGISGTGVTGPIGGGAGRGKANNNATNNANRKGSHSSAGGVGTAGGGGASKINVNGGDGEFAEEAVESPMDARLVAGCRFSVVVSKGPRPRPLFHCSGTFLLVNLLCSYITIISFKLGCGRGCTCDGNAMPRGVLSTVGVTSDETNDPRSFTEAGDTST